ncbi:hypothetical protein PV327_003319 [Microctonus hyperodae]|uniref:TMC domain-containing protein n=1 Tax=Microctonus hyperodae TaxID=165561 RepID=A0AA39G4P5_MICHY|nr:hypothetical protein PV327_003319 [Microctonus hyperodae]
MEFIQESHQDEVKQSEENILTTDEQTSMGILRIATRHYKNVSTSISSSNQELPERPSVTFALVGELNQNKSEETSLELAMPLSPTILRHLSRTDTAEDDDEDDYSASVSAILQKRPSRRSSRRRKRGSSPFVIEDAGDGSGNFRRRSSVFTTSSGDTAISIDVGLEDDVEESGTQEQIYEKLKLHKEVLGAVKHQPWPLRKKVKLVRQAKSFIRGHEGALQVRLAQSRSTRDVLARASIFINKNWQYFKRELVNLQTWIIPWELRIKEIESHFGSAVASYFTFLRWLFWINLVICLIITAFVAIPEVLTADKKLAGDRKYLFQDEIAKSKHFLTLWEFEGILKHSPFFYGWYTNWEPHNGGYRLPLAYFLANLIVYTYSFVAILRKMAKNSRMSKLSEKEDECAFSWKLFTGWDFMIGNPETAHNRVASIVLSFKEALLEEAEKEKKLGHWKIITVRIFVNLSVIFLLALSAYAVVEVVARSMQTDADNGWWRQNEITVVMSLISYIFPIFFEILGFLENYHPRKQLRLQLARIMEGELKSLKPKDSLSSMSMNNFNVTNCKNIQIPCSDMSSKNNITSSISSITTKTPTKSTTFVASIAALSLILMPNTTMKNPTIDENAIASKLYDGSDENYDKSYTNSYSVSETSPPLPYFFNDGVKWESYSDKDDSRADNNDYSDNDNLTYTDEDYSTSTEIINSIDSSTNGVTTNIFATSTNIEKTTSATSTVEPEETTSSPPPTTTSTIITSTTRGMTEINEIITTPEVDDVESINWNKEISIIKCFVKVCDAPRNCHQVNIAEHDHEYTKVSLSAISGLNMTTKRKLRRLCWETMFGQELAKLTVMDLMLTIIATLGVDFFRAVFVRYMNPWWCWDLEKQFPQYGDFKIAENILHLVNNQGMVWMGMFFSPGLTALNLLKLGILMYLRSWAVMTCNVPHEVVFRASRSNNFYLSLLLTMIFLCVLPVGYAIVWVEPSWHCGPFSGYYRIYHMATKSLKDVLPKKVHKALDYIASPGIIIPLLVLMTLIIYYMVSLAGSLREANNDLKIQLRYERTEERRKMFKIAEKHGQAQQDTSFAKWKKILPIMPSSKNDTPVARAVGNIIQQKRRRAIDRIRSMTSEADEATDIEPNYLLQDSLTQIDLKEVDDDNDIVLASNITKKGTKIPKIRIDGIESDINNSQQNVIKVEKTNEENEVNDKNNERTVNNDEK